MRWIMINQLDGAVLSLGPTTTGAKKAKEKIRRLYSSDLNLPTTREIILYWECIADWK